MPVLKFAELTPGRVKKLDAQRTVFLLPVSLMEAHGEHLPLGTDYMLSDFFAQQLAQRITEDNVFPTAVLFSPLAVGAGGIQKEGTINTDQDLVQRLIIDYGEKLGQWGFRFGLLVSIHAGQNHLQALEQAYEQLRPTGFNFLPLTNRLLPWFFTEDFIEQISRRLPQPLSKAEKSILAEDGHAGWWETAMMTLAEPQLVRHEALPATGHLDPSFAEAALQAVLQQALGHILQFK